MIAVSATEAAKRIREYLDSSVSYPFFVVVDGSAEYNSLLSGYSSFERIKASQYCNENSYANYDSLCDDIQNGSGRRILLGLGDCIALSGQINVLGRIKDLPISGKLVVLCRGIRAHVAKLNEADQKFNARRYCAVDSSLDYAIVQISPEVYFPHSYSGFQRLLQDLEIGKKGTLYVQTDLPLQSARSITSAYEAILEKTPGFSVEASVLNDECWSEYNQDSNLDKDEPDLLHWRTYLNMKLHPVSGGYLKLVLSSSPDYETYRKRLFDALLDIPKKREDFWELYGERKKLLKNLTGTESSRYVAVSAQKSEDRIYYLTDLTEPERFSIIKELVRLGRIPAELPVIYPALSKYLAEYTFSCKHADVLTAYFTRYKQQKVMNAVKPDFLSHVVNLAMDGNRIYNSLDTRGSLVEHLDDGKKSLYWIDALGVEYLGYIQAMAKDLGLHIFVQIGRAVLPTLTYLNKDFYDGWKGSKAQTKKLDDIKHEGEQTFNYESEKLPIHLAAELKIIDEALNWAKKELVEKRTPVVVIASDHGASRLAVINNVENKWKMATKGEHSGRCCPKNEVNEKPDTATDEHGYWVLANYDRFKGGRLSSMEVHGGASLEEVLVPVIQVSLLNGTIELKNMTETAWSSWDEDPFIEIFSPSNIEALAVRFNDRLYISTLVGEKTHKVVFDDFKHSGTYTADVLDGDNLIGAVTFTIEKRSGRLKSQEENDFFQ